MLFCRERTVLGIWGVSWVWGFGGVDMVMLGGWLYGEVVIKKKKVDCGALDYWELGD